MSSPKKYTFSPKIPILKNILVSTLDEVEPLYFGGRAEKGIMPLNGYSKKEGICLDLHSGLSIVRSKQR